MPDNTPEPTPLIGQAPIAEAMLAAIDKAFSVGAPTVLSLTGPRGSGRTRLLRHATELAHRAVPDARIHYGSARHRGPGPYPALSSILVKRFDILPEAPEHVRRGRLAAEVSRLLPIKDALILAETTHLLGHIAGVDFPDSLFLAPLADRPDELRRRAGTALKRILSADADEHPVLFLIDDAEGLDVPTWHILEELCRTQSHFCLMVAGDTAIGPRVTALAASGGRTHLAIDPLSEADVAAMIRILLPDLDSVPDKLVTGLTQKSLGNPSALREMVLSLVEQGLVHDSGNGIEVDLDQLPTGAQAGTLDEAIAARLDRLEPEERFVLACASIVGERFWDRAILAQQRQEAGSPSADLDPLEIWPDDHDADAVQGVLRRLTTKGFVESLGESQAIPGSHEYRFQLDRMRDAVYASQDENTRVARHTAVAKWLAVTAETHREGIAALIAPHLEEAGWLHRAGRAYLEAAAYERARLRTRTALTYIDKALPLIPEEDVVRRIDALHELGTLETILGHYDNAIAAFTEMLDHAYRTGSLGKGGAALSRIARVHRQRGEEERAQSLLERALEMFRKAHDVRGVASTLDDLAQVLHLRGEQDHAVPLAEEALAIRREHADQHGEAVSLFTLGSIALSRGDLEEADRYFSAALSIHDEVGDRERSIKAHNALGIIAYENDNVGGAIHEWRSALARAREIGARREQCFLLNNIGEAQIAEGHHAEAERALQEARELAEDLTDKRALADIARNQALLALRQDHSNAEAQFEEAMGLAEDYGGLEAMARAHRALGQGRAHREDTAAEDLEESYLSSLDLFRLVGNEREAARTLAELGHHLAERELPSAASEYLSEALDIMRRSKIPGVERVEATLLAIRNT